MKSSDSFELYHMGKANLDRIRSAAHSLTSSEACKVVTEECDRIEKLIQQAYVTGQNEMLDEIQLQMLQLSKYLALTLPRQ